MVVLGLEWPRILEIVNSGVPSIKSVLARVRRSEWIAFRFSIFSCQTCVCNVFLKRRRYGSAGLESTIGMKVPNKDIVTIGIKPTVS